MRPNDIVPVAVEFMAFNPEIFHLLIGDFAPSRILSAIQPAGDSQSLCRGRPGNEVDDGFIVTQGFSSPVRGNEGEPVFDLIAASTF